MDNGHLDEEDLVQDIKNSDEYKNIPKFITHIKELGNDAKSSPATWDKTTNKYQEPNWRGYILVHLIRLL